MNHRVYRNVFFCVVVGAVIIDSVFDLFALRQSFITDQTGKSIEQSYAVMSELADMDLALRDNMQARADHDKILEAQSVHSLQNHLIKFHRLTEHDPSRHDRLKAYDFLLQHAAAAQVVDKVARSARAISAAIVDARKDERELLVASVQSDESANLTSRNQILLASLLDLILILLGGVTWFYSDKSKKTEEKALRNSIRSSETTIGELKHVLARKALELRSAVHDLKNPLGSIKGFSDLIEEDCANPNSVAEMSHALQRLSNHTLSLVNSLLEVDAQTASISSEVRNANVAESIDDVVSSLRPQLKSKRQTINCTYQDHNAEVFGDPKKLWGVFMNLIGNAVKYSPLGSNIQVRGFAQDGQVFIEIEDEGPGFTQGDRERAFAQFRTLSAKPTGGEKATGMGLNLAREAVLAHNGKISIEDCEKGFGARIRVSFPEVPGSLFRSAAPIKLVGTEPPGPTLS